MAANTNRIPAVINVNKKVNLVLIFTLIIVNYVKEISQLYAVSSQPTVLSTVHKHIFQILIFKFQLKNYFIGFIRNKSDQSETVRLESFLFKNKSHSGFGVN